MKNKQLGILKSYLMLCMAMTVLTVGMFSCAKDKTDVSDLVSTVPSSAGCVIGLNLNSILQKAGYEIENGVIKNSKQNENIKGVTPEESELIDMLGKEGSGIDPTGAIIFYDANRLIMTFALSDNAKFRSVVEEKLNEKFNNVSGVDMCGNVAVKGAQAWIGLNDKPLDADLIQGYSSLSSSQSFVNNSFAEQIREMEEDVAGWGKLSVITKNFLNFNDMTMFNLVTGSLFENADQFTMKINFEKGKCETEIAILNDKGKPAKYMLPADKIDVSTVKTIGSKVDVVAGMTITPKFLEKFDKIGNTLGGVMFKNLTTMMKDVDGTVAIAFSNPEALNQNLSGVVTTKGVPSLPLKQLVSSVAPVREDNNLLRFSLGQMNGEMEIDKCSELLKGCTFGIVADFPVYPISELQKLPFMKNSLDKDFNLYCFRMKPEDGSINFQIIVETAEKKENILKTILTSNSGN